MSRFGIPSALMSLAIAGLLLGLTACTSTQPTPVSAPSPAPAVAPVTFSAPQWRPGDRWVYDWTSGAEKGTKTIEVFETKTVNAVSYFILRLNDVEHYYTKDLHWAAAVRESRVEARMVPPQPWFMWPLVEKQHWAHQGTFEDANGIRKFNDRFTVMGLEEIEVPAGTFKTVKVMREGERRDSDEYWYSADVRWYVRWIGRRGDETFEERLKDYQPRRR